MIHRRLYLLFLTVVFVAVGQARAEERCLSNAWKAYNEREFGHAIEFADSCIEEFGTQALAQETRVKAAPPCGKVNDQEKALIHRRGLLNDVATAAWIKTKSAEALGQDAVSTQAYTLVCEFSHGRTWDPRGWFWSPCSSSCP